MSNDLYKLVKESQAGNKQSLLEIINTFSPLIKKHSRNLNYDGAETDLVITLIEVIKSLPITIDNYIKEDEQIIGYISISMKNKYIQLSIKNCKKSNLEMSLDIE